jgi:hypothetical protein
MSRRLIFFVPLAVLGLAVFVALGGGIVMWLWNALLPPLFGWPQVTFWQAVGLLALCRILFGGFGFRGSHGRSWHRRDGRWERMTPEDRERFRQGIRDRFGFGSRDGESQPE